VACSYIANQPLCKQPLLGNSSVDTLFPRQRESTHYWKRLFCTRASGLLVDLAEICSCEK
jgi:hypothetical protein